MISSRRYPIVLVLPLVLAASLMTAAGQEPESLDKKLDRATAFARNDRQDQLRQAAPICEEVLADKQATDEQKVRALSVLVEALGRQKRPAEQLKTAQRMRGVMPKSKLAEQASLLLQAELLRGQNKSAEALEKVRELTQRQPDNPDGLTRFAELCLEANQKPEAYAAASRAAELAKGSDVLFGRALGVMQESAFRNNEPDKCIAAVSRLLEPQLVSRRDEYSNRVLRQRLVQCLVQMKKYPEAAAASAEYEKSDPDDKAKQSWVLSRGDALVEIQKYDEALAVYERVLTDYRNPEPWYGTQRKIIDVLTRKGDYQQALKAAHILFDAADGRSVADACRTVAEAFKALDTNVARANTFINYQRFGPAGEDGKLGTADDIAENPLDAVGYPSYPAREKAFAEGRKEAGDSAAGARYRAMSYLYTGCPKDALKYFMDAFARCNANEFQARADDLVLTGVRAARGLCVGLEEYYNFINYGPHGPDGKADNPDPFAALLK
jgi:tetratricopeptide (TPR) repeat protein